MPSETESKPPKAKDIEKQIFEAIENKEFDKVIEIVRANPKLNLNFVDKDDLSPLQHACHIGDVDFTKFLLDSGADVNYTNRKDGYTPLMFAAISSKDGVVRLLLERGVVTTVENCVKRTAAQMASFVGLYRITGIINAWVPYEDSVLPFTKCRELEDKPRLPSEALGLTLHKYIVINNSFPLKLFIYLRENLDLLKYGPECIYVLENLSYRALKLGRDVETFKYYYLQYFIDYVLKLYKKNNQKDQQSESEEFNPESCAKCIRTLARRFLIHPNRNQNPDINKLAIDCLLRFPHTHLPFYQSIVLLFKMGDTEFLYINHLMQIIDGVKALQEPEACSVCQEPGKNKKCSKCKSVYYCGPACQNLDWFMHKKFCKSPEESPLLYDNDNVKST